MTLGGARGETAAEMRRALHFEADADQVTRAAGEVLQDWKARSGPTILYAASRLFGEKSYAFEKPFLDATESAFGAPLQPVDFAKSPERARQAINGWVEKETEWHINDLLPRGVIDGLTHLVLVNAIYFKADWASPFEREATWPGPFYLTSTRKKDVPMMHDKGRLRFAALDTVRVIELPYEGKDASMVFLLPEAVDGLAALEQSLTAEALDRWTDALKRQRVYLTLPRFAIEPASPMSLRDTFRALGMRLAFDPMKADLTGIANPKHARDRLYLHDVVHKAFVNVHEQGTEAGAGASTILMAGGKLPEPEVFCADHPFLFVLRDTETGMILFIGRVTEP